MSYQSTVYNVMIASPSDVQTEREIAPEIIYEWNTIHSRRENQVLLPLSWEHDSYPIIGDRPQAIINKQILKNADLLIAIFWTRFGSPTGEFDSGTAEEIQEHIDTGKPALVYFSSTPVLPSSIDPVQYDKLKDFMSQLRKTGLVQDYSDHDEFRILFIRQLSQIVNDTFSGKVTETDEPFSATPQIEQHQLPITDPALKLLRTAVQDPGGVIMRVPTMGGLIIQSNQIGFVEDNNPRSEALWEGAIEELLGLGFLKTQGTKGEIFKVTRSGYDFIDRLDAV